MSSSVRSRLRDHGDPRPHGVGEHVELDTEHVAHVPDRKRHLGVELADQPAARGDHLFRPRAGADPTGAGAGRRTLAPDPRAKVGVVKRVDEQP